LEVKRGLKGLVLEVKRVRKRVVKEERRKKKKDERREKKVESKS
jgi:hypothetical protein